MGLLGVSLWVGGAIDESLSLDVIVVLLGAVAGGRGRMGEEEKKSGWPMSNCQVRSGQV